MMSDDDSLVKTRARRANAGSRLKHLISLEERDRESQVIPSRIISEEDVDVNLLFQEDDFDEEFRDEESESEASDNNDRSEEEVDGEQAIPQEESEQQEDGDSESDGISARVDSDEQFSDSELSLSDDDESEGEKELEREEKIQNKKNKRNKLVVPEIKKFKADNAPKRKRKRDVAGSDLLMQTDRRSSSRAAVVENKHALVQRLQANEKKRAKTTPVVRQKYAELTQEERLEQAVETEKENILALNQFREQEIVKKERQKQLLQSRREKLKNVIRLVSQETFISPLDEVKAARRQQELAARAKKKPGRKRKNPLPVEKIRIPGEVDMELPIAQAELGHLIKEKEDSNSEVRESSSEATENMEIKDQEMGPDSNLSETSDNVEQASKHSTGISDGDESRELNERYDKNSEVEGDKSRVQADGNGVDEKRGETSEVATEDITGAQDQEVETYPDTHKEITEKINSTPPHDTEESSLQVKQEDNGANVTIVDEGSESKVGEVKEEKKVKFADEVDEEIRDDVEDSKETESKQSTPSLSIFGEDEIFEGPPQRIARNLIHLTNFEKDKHPVNMGSSDVKTVLFGKDSLLPASRRFKDLTTILRIRQVENPYAVSKDDKDTLFVSVSQLTEEDPLFDDLRRLPRLGEQEEIVEEVEENEQEVNPTIVINTEAPAGLYLPNGNKKVCLISGTEVKYFDPSNGIPYSSVETYRLLKTIEQGSVPWYSISSELNDGVPTELYLGSRQEVRHAAGVPEGFEA